MKTYFVAALLFGSLLSLDVAAQTKTLKITVPEGAPYTYTNVDGAWELQLPSSAELSGNLSVSGSPSQGGRLLRFRAIEMRMSLLGGKQVLEFSSDTTSAPEKTAAAAAGQTAKKSTQEQAPVAPLPQDKPAATKTAPEDIAATNYKKYTVDFTVPESPAFALLGIAPEKITRPSTPRDLAIAISNGFDEQGKAKNGLAIEFSPYDFFAPAKELTLNEYATNPKTRFLANTIVSLGMAKGAEASDKSMRLGLGLQMTLFDYGDPRLDSRVLTCLQSLKPEDRLSGAPRAETSDTTDAQNAQFIACRDIPKQGRDAKLGAWNKSAGTLGFGQVWSSDTGNFSDRKGGAKGGWLSLGYGFEGIKGLEDSAQLVFMAKRLLDERVADKVNAGKFITQDNTLAGARLRFTRDSTRFYGTTEASYQRLKFANGKDEIVRRFAFGLEFKMSDDLWLVTSIGGEGGRKNGENQSFVLSSIRYAPCSKKDCRLPD